MPPQPNRNAQVTHFADRHVGPSADDVTDMLSAVGAETLDDLIDAIVPPSIRSTSPLGTPAALTEQQALARLADYAGRNTPLVSMIGMGYYGTHTPAVILRNVLENPAWYTAYTPYQPEISQGRLEALLNFQTMIADLTGLDLANASLLDEATAAAEAMTMARRAWSDATERSSSMTTSIRRPSTSSGPAPSRSASTSSSATPDQIW